VSRMCSRSAAGIKRVTGFCTCFGCGVPKAHAARLSQRQHQRRDVRTVTQRARARAGFHYCTTLLHKVQMALKLETDPSEVLNELIYCCRKVPCSTLPYGSLTHQPVLSHIALHYYLACAA